MTSTHSTQLMMRRLAAACVDALIVTLVFGGVAIAICAIFYDSIRGLPHALGTEGEIVVLVALSILLVGPWLYSAFSLSSVGQATIGQRMLDLKTIRNDGMPVVFMRATARHIVKLLAFCFIYGVARIAVDSIVSPVGQWDLPWYFGYVSFAMTLVVTMLPILFTSHHQALHDRITQTNVVEKIEHNEESHQS